MVDAYVSASPRPVLTQRRAALRMQAVELLAVGYPVEWLAARAAEMPAHGWVGLARHAERSTVPLPGQQRARTGPAGTPEEWAGLPPWCGRCGDGGLSTAARQLVTTGRRRILRLTRHWPWTGHITAALDRLAQLPDPG